MKIKNTLLILFAGMLILTACEKTLQTEPKNSISAEVALTESAGVEGLLVSTYNSLQGSGYYGRDIFIIPEVLSDNMRIVSTNSNRFVNESNNGIGATIGIWTAAYSIINRANGVIKYADIATGFTANRKSTVKGEAYFVRALVYFDLVKTYAYNPKFVVPGQDRGGVPIVTQFVENYPADIIFPSRAPAIDVYNLVKADLTAAIASLDNTTAPKRASKAAAYALLSRVNLYLGEWQNCVDNATLAIAANVGTFVDPGVTATVIAKSDAYKTIWNNPSSPESIFELNYELTESLGSDGLSSIYTRSNQGGSPTLAGAGYGDAAPQANLIADYEIGDIRRDILFQIVKGSETILWNQKYPAGKGPQIDNVKLIRVSEMYLNRAEANVMLNTATSIANAQADLNKVRLRANLPIVTATFASVFKERRVELAYEGHRWFDLLRTGSAINKSNSTLPASTTPSSTIPYTDFRLLARIPLSDVANNTNLAQNFGY